jgi:membrane protein
VQAILHWLQQLYPPGFEGVSLYDSLNFFRKEIFSSRFTSRANSISFSFIMALPPLLLFFFTLIPYLPLPEQKILSGINDTLNLIAPNDKIKESISRVMTDFITHKKNVLLSFSVLLTVFYSSNGMMALMNNFDKRMPGFKKRNGLKRRGYAILLTLMLILVILLAIAVLIFQAWFAQKMQWQFLHNMWFLKLLTFLLVTVMLLVSISMIYKYGISSHQRIRFFNPGAIIATFLILALTAVFFYAVNNLVNYDKIYGSVGTLIIFLLWINYMAHIVLIGFELNSSIIVNKNLKS